MWSGRAPFFPCQRGSFIGGCGVWLTTVPHGTRSFFFGMFFSQRKSKANFGWFRELISRFEFEFRRCENFFERFEFLMRSKFNHMQQDCTCACAVACLHPHNSISNVVVSLTIHDNLNISIIRCSRKHETIVEGRASRSWNLGFGGERQIEPSSG